MGHNKVREALKALYPKSKRWSRKVDGMTDSQAIAIYWRLCAEGKIKV